MDRDVAFVLNGFVKLSRDQRDEFVESVNKYIKDEHKRVLIEKAVRSEINFGPMPSGCPCCGRST